MIPFNRRFLDSLHDGTVFREPYRHWVLRDVLPDEVCRALTTLPIPAPEPHDTAGRRETHNSSRVFFSPAACREFPVCRVVADTLAAPEVTRAIATTCATSLRGSFLRIEYCQDQPGFWLEPHTDIGAKLLTMQIYLSEGGDAESWGTDILDPSHAIVRTVPAVYNSALVFVPGKDTWHGYHRRPMSGLRTSLLVNFVKDEWRSRHELVDPDHPVG
jgi:hypothetical protein